MWGIHLRSLFPYFSYPIYKPNFYYKSIKVSLIDKKRLYFLHIKFICKSHNNAVCKVKSKLLVMTLQMGNA